MQRAQSAVDFSTLLNPEPPSRPPDLSVRNPPPLPTSPAPVSVPDQARPAAGDNMTAAAVVLRPNGPLPGGQALEAANELPRPYKCPLCDKAFHRLEHQTRHIRTHTGEKPHACQYSGCSKKFSRSDELTRHSRIHSNPNSRRGNKGQQGFVQGLMPDMMPPPPAPKAIRSAPPTAMSSPNQSPPHMSPYSFSPSAGLTPYTQSRGTPGSHAAPDMNLLARAAHQVERDSLPQPLYASSRHHSYLMGTVHRTHLPGLQAYHISRTHSNEDDDHYGAHSSRQPKRSRHNSPNSTAPPSPTLSHDSLSPTPEITPLATPPLATPPLATPAHSPRLPPLSAELAPFRHLAIAPQQFVPALAPLEPSPDWQFPGPPPPQPKQQQQASSSGAISLSDILSRPVGAQRKLPVPQHPRVAIHDLLGPSDGYNNSGRSSSCNSLTGGDLGDRA